LQRRGIEELDGADGNWQWGYLEASYSNARDDFKKYCSAETKDISFSSEWSNFRTRASEVLANAWVQCVKHANDVGRPAFPLYYLSDPRYFRFDAKYRKVQGDNEIPYKLIVTPDPNPGDFSCTTDGQEYDEVTLIRGWKFMVGPYSSLTCKRRVASQTHDVELKPIATKATAPSHDLLVVGRYQPASRMVTATETFDAPACTFEHCDKSHYDRKGDSIEAYEGRMTRLDDSGDDTGSRSACPRNSETSISWTRLSTTSAVRPTTPDMESIG
jgi:hypothetical protein